MLPELILGGLVLRATVGVNPHSGQGSPPMFGDFEAQRHWMEVTLNLPASRWYVNSTDNDLLYWGLDYPPLTAYWSLGFGYLARAVGLGSLVDLVTSRGAESPSAKLFMRMSVLISDLLIYLPAVVIFCRCLTRDVSRGKDSQQTRLAPLLAAVALIFHPALIIIDHGHFQYNGVSLGLCLLGFAALFSIRPESRDGRSSLTPLLVAAAFFTSALNYKQMTLYFAPVFFVALGSLAIVGSSSLLHVLARLASIGGVVLVGFAIFWTPLCDPGAEHGCWDGWTAVISRLFPFNRSLFEDKVSNIWCALEPLLHFRSFIYNERGEGGTTRRVVMICTVTTLVLILPPLFMLGRWILVRWGGEGVGDEAGVGGGGQEKGVTRGSAGGDDGDDPVATTGHSRRARRGRSNPPPSSTPPPSSPALPPPHPITSSFPSLGAVVLLASIPVSLAFFLASYQVHEKSILLPALPITCLLPSLPSLGLLFTVVATWSLWPLLLKDGLLLQATTLLIAYVTILLMTGGWGWVRGGDDLTPLRDGITRTTGKNISRSSLIKGLSFLHLGLPSLISLLCVTLPPPPSLPDLYPYLTALVGAALFTATYVWGVVILWYRVKGWMGAPRAANPPRTTDTT